jgi:hypothetical protein
MGQGALIEPTLPPARAAGADARFVSVIVPVVERADDLMELHRSFSAALDAQGEEYEFVFVFDGGPAPSVRPPRCGWASSAAAATSSSRCRPISRSRRKACRRCSPL